MKPDAIGTALFRELSKIRDLNFGLKLDSQVRTMRGGVPGYTFFVMLGWDYDRVPGYRQLRAQVQRAVAKVMAKFGFQPGERLPDGTQVGALGTFPFTSADAVVGVSLVGGPPSGGKTYGVKGPPGWDPENEDAPGIRAASFSERIARLTRDVRDITQAAQDRQKGQTGS